MCFTIEPGSLVSSLDNKASEKNASEIHPER